jgi:sugar phosphate permease
MLKKVLLNVFYNIAIFTMVLSLIWGVNKERYSIVVAAVFAIGLFVFLKVRLLKEIKHLTKKP